MAFRVVGGKLHPLVAERIHEIYTSSAFNEEARRAIVKREPTACLWQNEIMYLNYNNTFVVTRHAGTENEAEAPFDPKIFMKWVDRCPHPLAAVQVGTLLPTGKHYNMIIINRLTNTIEHFEPLGQHSMWTSESLSPLIDLFGAMLPTFEYVPPSQICPRLEGIQTTLGRMRGSMENYYGTCAMWSLWYFFVRVQNPHLSPKEAVAFATKNAFGYDGRARTRGKTLERYIAGFTEHLVEMVNLKVKMKLFKEYRAGGRIIPHWIDPSEYGEYGFKNVSHIDKTLVEFSTPRRVIAVLTFKGDLTEKKKKTKRRRRTKVKK